jgi:hypothetical protein
MILELSALLNLDTTNIENINNIDIYGHFFESMIISEIKYLD